MAIITPARKFEGGEMNTSLFGQTIKSGIRIINFRDPENQGGVYLFILPPYKLDSQGNGVWYKVFTVRDNFGLDTKEKFSVGPNCPVEWFAAKCKHYFPKYAATEKTQREGRDIKVYPPFGRTTKKVVFNTAFFRNLGLGSHVLEIPQYGCADQIDQWHRTKTPEGGDAPMLNDPRAAIPVEFKLEKNVKGNPWRVTISSSKIYQIPDQLADSDNLYNLDDVILYPQQEELIEKLRKTVPVEMFNKCMEGYSNGPTTVSMAMPAPVAAFNPVPVAVRQEDNSNPELNPVPTNTASMPGPTPVPTPAVAPKFNPPPAVIPPQQPTAPTSPAPAQSNPVAGMSVQAAMNFLKG